MRFKSIAVAAVAVAISAAVMAAPARAENIGQQGCTPGYWKNHTASWEEYDAARQLRFIFMTGGASIFPTGVAAVDQYATTTAAEALSFKGGSDVDGAARILLRAAVAAFLNAAHEGVGYPYRRFTEYNILAKVDAALSSGDRDTMLALAAELDAANNLGCPL